MPLAVHIPNKIRSNQPRLKAYLLAELLDYNHWNLPPGNDSFQAFPPMSFRDIARMTDTAPDKVTSRT